MISNPGFVEAINTYGSQLDFVVTIDGTTYDNEEISKMRAYYNGSLFSTIMRCLDITFSGKCDFESGTPITNVKIGASPDDDTPFSYIDFGTYFVNEVTYDVESDSTIVRAYDSMVKSMVQYDMTLSFATEMTIEEYTNAVLSRLGWVSGTNIGTLANANVTIGKDFFATWSVGEEGDITDYQTTATFRTVLEALAQATGTTIFFRNDNKVYFMYPNDTGATITDENLSSVTVGDVYGPINSLALNRDPVEDSVYIKDDESIAANGETQIAFSNNPIMDDERDKWLEGIFAKVDGLTCYPFDISTYGMCIYEPMDVVTLQVKDTYVEDGTDEEVTPTYRTYKVIIVNDDINCEQGMEEKVFFDEPTETTTDYTISATRETETYVKVDKLQNQINLVASSVEGISTEIKQLPTSIEAIVQGEVTKYIKLTTEGLRIGQEGSKNSILITDTQICLQTNNETIAFLEGDKLVLKQASSGIRIGNFQFRPRSDGTLDFRKVGSE